MVRFILDHPEVKQDYYEILSAFGFYALMQPSLVYFYFLFELLAKLQAFTYRILRVQDLNSSFYQSTKWILRILIYGVFYSLFELKKRWIHLGFTLLLNDLFELVGVRIQRRLLMGVLIVAEVLWFISENQKLTGFDYSLLMLTLFQWGGLIFFIKGMHYRISFFNFKSTVLITVVIQAYSAVKLGYFVWIAPLVSYFSMIYLKWVIVPLSFLNQILDLRSSMEWVELIPVVSFRMLLRLNGQYAFIRASRVSIAFLVVLSLGIGIYVLSKTSKNKH